MIFILMKLKYHKSYIMDLKIFQDKAPYNKQNFVKNDIKKSGICILITAILSKIYGMFFPGGTELCLKQICNFKKPFFLNDTLKINLKVIQINYEAKLLTISIIIRNQKNSNIFEGETIFQLNLHAPK